MHAVVDQEDVQPFDEAPSPPGHLAAGHLTDFARDPLGFLTDTARRSGPFVRLRFGFTRACLLSDPELVKEVLVTRNSDFIKARAFRRQRPLLGNGLLLNEGDSWLRQRRLAQPAFHRQQIASYAETMVQCAETHLAGWKPGEVRDFHMETQRLTAGIASRTLFGNDVEGEAGSLARIIETAMEHYADQRGLARLAPAWLPLPARLRYQAAIRKLDRILLRLIRERRARTDDPGDLLSILLHARDEDGSSMDDRQVRDEAVNLFLGGYDTPALALSWALYLLARHPDAERRLHAELNETLAGQSPTVDDLPGLRYAEAITREAMRLYPPAWILAREAVRDTVVGGYHVPQGTQVLFSQWVLHRDPCHFDEAERFAPERWLNGSARKAHRFAYLPFGAGQRICIGARYAEMQMLILLAVMVQRFRFVLASDEEVKPWPSVTLRPRGGLPMLLENR